MVELQIKVPEKFLDEEVRCGHTITRQMKELWAVELDLYMELKRVCDKHGLRFSADAGTLLGAVRHKGFIPWDDDMDFSMPRADYEKLREIAPTEFKHPYYFETFHSDPHFIYGTAKLLNLDTTGYISPFDLKHGIFIDIFPMDAWNDDEEMVLCQKKEISSLFAKYQRIVTCSYKNYVYQKGIPIHRKLARILYFLFLKVLNINTGGKIHRNIFKKYEQVCERYNGGTYDKVGAICVSLDDIVNIQDYDNLIETDYEFLKIPIIRHYDENLTTLYGNWHEMVKGGQLHTFKKLDTNKPFREVITPDVLKGYFD